MLYIPVSKVNRIRHDLSDKEKGSSDLCNIENLAAPIIDAALLIDISLQIMWKLSARAHYHQV